MSSENQAQVVSTPSGLFRFGSVEGSSHKAKNIGNQDSLNFFIYTHPGTGKKYRVGLVSDGCTNKKISTQSKGRFRSSTGTGSSLMVELACKEIISLIDIGTSTENIPTQLFPRLLAGFNCLLTVFFPPLVISRNAAINRYLLCTLVGFIEDGETVVTFSAGDGIVIVNSDFSVIDQNDKPFYPAINLFSSDLIKDIALPSNFEIDIFDASKVNRIGVATDGLVTSKDEPRGIVLEDQEGIWDYHPTISKGLQNWLNIRQQDTIFKDDTTAVLLQLS